MPQGLLASLHKLPDLIWQDAGMIPSEMYTTPDPLVLLTLKAKLNEEDLVFGFR